MKHIGNLTKTQGSTHSKKRIGRGEGSGKGGTSTRGHKGQKSRSGAKIRRGFEGGQMPINRRVPKFGFTNIHKIEYNTINVGKIQDLIDSKRIESNDISLALLYELRIIKSKRLPLKILGNGEINTSVNIIADGITATAKEKIEKAGGKVTING